MAYDPHYNPNQPRVPKGQPHGGEWTRVASASGAGLLLRELNVPVEGPFVSGKAGSFSVEGSAGEDAAAHVAQFRRMDTTLFPKLRTRWSG